MRRQILYFGTVLILTISIWGHVSELFDHWDNTFRTGNDIEYSAVIVMLVAGAVIGFTHFAVALAKSRTTTARLLPQLAAAAAGLPTPVSSISHSPPISLRI